MTNVKPATDEGALSSRDAPIGRVARVRRVVARLSPLTGRRRATIVTIALFSAIAALAEAGVLVLVAQVAVAMSMSTEFRQRSFSFGPIDFQAGTSVLLAVAGALAVVRLALQIVVARLPARVSGAVQRHLRTELFGSFLEASWSEKANEREGHLQELMGSQTTQAGAAVLHLATGLSAVLMFATLLASALVLHAGVAAAVAATATVLFVALRPLSRRVRRRSALTSEASVGQAAGVAESVRLAEEVEVFGANDAQLSRVTALVRDLEQKYVRTRALMRMVAVLYESAVIFLLIGGLALLYAIGTTRMAILGAVVLLLVRASAYGQQLQIAYQGVGEALPYLERLSRAIESYRANARRRGHRPMDSLRTIDFESVSFSYKATTPVIRDVSFSIQAGEAIGVVGPTGAGKSTLVQLLLRLREPESGRYLVNSMVAGEIDDAVWQRKVAYLPQETRLLRGTVADNIRFHRDWIGDDAIEHAARLAHVHEDIMSWPAGYQTVIGQRADAVSGGERQRLCLARALAGGPELLILDEPTSALDARSEQLIRESLGSLHGSLTLIVIAHRLTTLSLCDRVMIIRDGRVEAFAPAASLYDSNAFYREAVDLGATRLL